MLAAFHLASVGSRDEIQSHVSMVSGAAQTLLKATVAQYDGLVDEAIRLLRRQLRTASESERGPLADVLAPILISRSEVAEVSALAIILEEAQWIASARAFRAQVAATTGDRSAAIRLVGEARALADFETDEIIHFRVLQRLAFASYYSNQHVEAIELALTSAAMAIKHHAWRAASAGYSIAYNVHHDVTGDLDEADRFATLWGEAATKSHDLSFEHLALVAQFELAVQFADLDRMAGLEQRIRGRLLPQQYEERFAFALSHAVVEGAKDLVAMRTLLQVLQSTKGRSRGESALCSALIAVTSAAFFEDDGAREALRDAMSHLGRPVKNDRAYEGYYRRLARVSICAAHTLMGEDALADRAVSVRDARTAEEMASIPQLIKLGKWDLFPRSIRGLARVFASAMTQRRSRTTQAGLTIAEYEVLRFLAEGWSAGKIATTTDRSVNTVYNHTRSILSKLDAGRASEAVAIARRRGIIN